MDAHANVIDVRGLSKRFGDKVAVKDFDLRVQAGEIFGFLGPNGSGKTTAMRMLCGLLTPDGGSGTCLGYDIIRETLEIKRHVGYMTQRFSLYEDLSIEENLDFIARMYGLKNRKAVVSGSLERLKLTERRKQLAGTLSGGWKQRLALAACMLHEPRLLLLDEPTAGVDPKARRTFWEEIHQLAAQGIATLVSTHYMDEAERCHKLAYIAYGKLLTHGTVSEVMEGARLTTWVVSGAGVVELARQLHGLPGVEQVVAFGNTLHVSGTDAEQLQNSITPLRMLPGYNWMLAKPSLEDVFISLMGATQDSLS